MRLFRVESGDKFAEYKEQDFKIHHHEENLENWLESNPDAIVEDSSLLFIGRQIPTNLGSVIDLLAIDRTGDVAVIELKRDCTPRETIAQALEYAAFIESLDYDQLDSIYQEYAGGEGITLSEQHRMFFALSDDEAVSFNKEQRVVVVGQEITPAIRQTAAFLRRKGIRATCLEFKYFESKTGERLLSVDIVVGHEPPRPTALTTGTRRRTTKPEFLADCLATARPVYEKLLELAEQRHLPVIWGVKGFSLNAKVAERNVALCYGYPKSTFNGAIYTAFDRVLEYIDSGQSVIDDFRELLSSVGFEATGKTGQVKHPLDRELTEQEIAAIVNIFSDFATEVVKHGLKHND